MSSLAHILGPDGLLTERLPGFSYRAPQLAMAEAIARVMETRETLICEAGTGTGKTFSYLVPAILCGRKVLISTGTRNLQDQLFHRDLPQVREALGVPVRVALLKGRANYLCRHRLTLALDDPASGDPQRRVQLRQVLDWSKTTRRGDVAELALAEDAAVWPAVTSTSDNCLGQTCPEWQDCHLVAARREAQAADLVVVNHHLFCADLALKDEGFGDILPGADSFIVDEAHQLPEVAASFFGILVSARQLQDLARDTELEQRREAGDSPELRERAAGLRHAVQDLLQLSARLTRADHVNEKCRKDLGVRLHGFGKTFTVLHVAVHPAKNQPEFFLIHLSGENVQSLDQGDPCCDKCGHLP